MCCSYGTDAHSSEIGSVGRRTLDRHSHTSVRQRCHLEGSALGPRFSNPSIMDDIAVSAINTVLTIKKRADGQHRLLKE